MNICILLIIAIPLFYLADKLYARYIEKVFSMNDNNKTPAVEINDNRDYVPTKPLVLFSHHFASIAGAGPIIGPTLGIIFGYIPVWLWVVIGGIFIGAVHDFTALFASVREKGKSVAEVAEKSLGTPAFLLFIGFTILSLLMVNSVFLNLTAAALTSFVPLDTLNLPANQSLLKTKFIDGVEKAQIGGIASTSVIVITLFAPIIGYFLYRRKVNVYIMSVIALLVCLISVRIGLSYPISIDPNYWKVILSIYVFIAAGIPVWLVLQPRDFTNSFFLYLGIFSLFIGGVIGGINGVTFSAPAFNVSQGNLNLGYIWPILFITVACGAVSGFHALVAGGTSSKQVAKESHIRKIGYRGMLLESILSIGVITAVGGGIKFNNYMDIVFPKTIGKENPVLAFSLGCGGILNKSFSLPVYVGTIFGILMIEGFLVTTLDTSVRLNRYLFEELWQRIFKKPYKILKSYYFNSFLCVILMFYLAHTNTILQLWKIFGSANQLLAGLTLIAVCVWLLKQKRKYLFTLIPGIFMMVTTISALIYSLIKVYIPTQNFILIPADILLLILSAGVIYLFIKNVIHLNKKSF